jgi:RNA polymerase primary sigma factor
LLGELNLSVEEARDLGQAIAQLVKRNGQMPAIGLLRRQYPASLAVYLVFKGLSGYESGNYWSAVGEETGLNSVNAHQEMGQAFEKFLSENNLPLFRGLISLDKARRYVTRILLHGGIPDTSLDDYFTYFLQLMQAQATTSHADVRDFIEEWLNKHASSVPVDKSIPRFLEHGGTFALDFVTRCLELSEYYEEHHRLPVPEAIGLPPRVLSAYKRWSDEQQQSTQKRQVRLRLARPTLMLDPWDDGPVIDLPAQILSHDLPVESCRWIIGSQQAGVERQIETFPLSPNWSEAGWETDAYQFALPAPGNYRVTLEVNDGKENRALRTWYFPCASSAQAASLLTFDGKSGEFLPTRETLSAKQLWLLIPRKLHLQTSGGVKREVVEQFTGAWSRFKAEAWDLSAATSVTLETQQWTVEPDMTQFQPYLQGNTLADVEQQPGQPHLFTGQLPDLFIPLPSQRAVAIEAERWRLTVSAVSENKRQQLLATSLAETGYRYVQQGETPALHLPLAYQEALKTARRGLFEIALRGPLGRDIMFQVAVLPEIQIHMHEQDRIRVPRTGKVPALTLVITSSEDIQLASPGSGVSLQAHTTRQYRIMVTGECSRADLQFSFDDASGFQGTIPFSIPLPILTWALVEGQGATLHGDLWHTRVISRPQVWLEQAEAPRLLVGLVVGTQRRTFSSASVFVNYNRREQPQELHPRGRGKTWLTFQLSEAEDSVRTGRNGSVLFELELAELPGLAQRLRLPVLLLEQTLGLTSLHLEGVLVEQSWLCDLTWQEDVPFNNRHLLLWSLLRPWETALDIPLPDPVRAHFEFEVPLTSLAPGNYRAEIILLDPWSGSLPTRPFTATANCVDLTLGNAQERIVHLRTVVQDLPGLLEHLLGAELETYRQRRALELSAHMTPHFISHILMALLTLQNDATASKAGGSFDILSQLLVQTPVPVLAQIARLSLPLSEQARRPFEELLWRIAPVCEPLLRQIYQDASIEIEDLAALTPRTHQDDLNEEVFALLREAGVQIKEKRRTEPAVVPEILNIEDLPPWVFSDNQLDSMRLYLNEIRRYPLLNAEQERRLAEQIFTGREATQELEQINEGIHTLRTTLLENRVKIGKEASQHLANANLRLVISIARRYIGRGMDFLDLIQNGNLGLLTAIDKFDGTRGYKFSTYATWWIRQSITRRLAEDTRLIRLPVYIVEELNLLKRATVKLQLTLDREPTVEELAEELQYTLAKVQLLQTLREQPRSLDQPINDEDGTLLGDILEQEDSDPADQVLAWNLHNQIEEALSYLTSRQQAVIKLRFGLLDDDKKTLEEIGQMMNITRERVRQIEEHALKKLESPALRKFFSDYYVYIPPETVGTDAIKITANKDITYPDGRRKRQHA